MKKLYLLVYLYWFYNLHFECLHISRYFASPADEEWLQWCEGAGWPVCQLCGRGRARSGLLWFHGSIELDRTAHRLVLWQFNLSAWYVISVVISMLIVLTKLFVGVFFFKQNISDFLQRKNSNLKTVLSCYTISLV